jgi:hypothetical protein
LVLFATPALLCRVCTYYKLRLLSTKRVLKGVVLSNLVVVGCVW